MDNFRLLIHHHAVAYRNSSGEMYLSSFIGRWVNALSRYVGQIGLLLYESNSLRPEQDDVIYAENVVLWSLGAPGKTWDRIPRIRRLRRICAKASQQADGLLVRGVTPRQMNVWKAVSLRNKAFLLVGSLLESQPTLRPTFWGIYEALMWHWRRFEVIEMTRQGLLMANSPHLVNELASLNRPATFVPTNSIRSSEFVPFRVRELSTPRKILFCGRVAPEKGIRELIQAVARLNFLQTCVLDIVGPVESAFRADLQDLILRLGISENINWHDRIPYGEVLFSFYREADAFVLPTYYEGFPHVLWEAFANCCPVITTTVGGIPALLIDNKHGLLVPPKNVDALATSLQRLFSDDDLRYKMIREAYHLARSYTVEACAVALVETLQKKWQV